MLLAAYYGLGFGAKQHWLAAVCWGIAAQQWGSYSRANDADEDEDIDAIKSQRHLGACWRIGNAVERWYKRIKAWPKTCDWCGAHGGVAQVEPVETCVESYSFQRLKYSTGARAKPRCLLIHVAVSQSRGGQGESSVPLCTRDLSIA